MSITLPDFTSLPSAVPQPSGAMPSFAATDPVSTAEGALGQGLEKAGKAAETVGAYGDIAKVKMDRATADAALTGQVIQLNEQMKTETDPAKITALGQQYQTALQQASGAFNDPAAAKMWLAERSHVAAQGQADAQLRNTGVYRDQYVAGTKAQLDNLARVGATATDSVAFPAAFANIDNLTTAGVASGALTNEQAYAMGKGAQRQLIAGRADSLINAGQPEAATALLDQHSGDLDPITAEAIRAKAVQKDVGIRVAGAANRALGMGGPSSPGLSIGGAIPQAIVGQAQQQGVDPNLALTTAQIESSMGRNLGSRGNIFQLGQPEWASVGGGQMGEPGTDIKNGVAFLSKTQSALAANLGRQPQPWETYLAHQQGVAGATALLNNPDAPAGQVVPAQNISGNGGDPSAPASAFTAKWQNTFNNTSQRLGGPTTPSQGFDMAGGDSIGVGFIRAGKLGGQAVDSVTMPGATDADAAGSRNPQQGLDFIAAHPQNFQGKTVLWSSGLMNGGSNPAASLPLVGQQLDALKQAGATVVLAGVDQGKFAPYNAQLAQIASDHGVPFAGPLPTDNVHPGPQGYQQYAANAAKLLPQTNADQMAGPGTDQGPPPSPAANFARNAPFLNPGVTATTDFQTHLDPDQEAKFRQWVTDNHVPFNPDAKGPQDYDMRGFYQGLMNGDPHAQSAVDPNDNRLHYSDWWKTPYHQTFSNESQWANPATAPHWNDQDQLVTPQGAVVFDDRKQGAGAAAPTSSQTAPITNRTGLPSLTQVWQNIQSDPGLRNDQERDAAFNHAKTLYVAQEADAARAVQVQTQLQQATMRNRENQIYADVYSPNPSISAQQIATDPAFDGSPDRRKAMIDLINSPPGSAVPAAQSYALAQSLIDRMRLAPGTDGRISTRDQVYDQMHGLNRTDLDYTLKKLDEISSPGDNRFSTRLEDFFKGVTPQIDKSGVLPGMPTDSVGKAKAYEYRRMVEDKVAEYRGQGKNPDDLLNPKKPDYLGAPETIKPFKRTMAEALTDMTNSMGGGTQANAAFGPAPNVDLTKIGSLQDMQTAVKSNPALRDQAIAIAVQKGWIVPDGAPPPTPGYQPQVPLR